MLSRFSSASMRGVAPAVVALLALLAVTACTTPEEEPDPYAVPEAYAGMENPLSGDEVAIAEGQTLWGESCTGCHGGAVEYGEDHAHGADYLYWRISEGGAFAPFDSEMPAFKEELSDDQIWKLISYLEHAEAQAHAHDH